MNQLIQELLKQATDTVEIVNPDTGITHHREFFDKEKFAQLFVRECMKVVINGKYSDMACEGNSHRISYNNGRDEALSDIRKYFGVTE